MTVRPRRGFLKLALAAGLAPTLGGLVGPARADAARPFAPQPSDWQAYQIRTAVSLPQAAAAQVWLPVPSLDNAWQKSIGNEIGGNATKARIVTDPGGTRYVHAVFDGSAVPELLLISSVQTRNRTVDWTKPRPASEDPALLQAALRPTGHKPLDGIVAETAARITAGATTDLDKVKAIYAWVVGNCHRNLDTPGCGPGDVVATLTSAGLGGKCADLNGLFVALARASGVPARDVYGVRVAPSAFGFKQLGANSETVTAAQHCRAEVWLTDYGWTAMDPADVLKVMRAETDTSIKSPDDPLVTQVNAALLGNWEGNWVGFNTAEDLMLAGRNARLPFLMYPQAESAGKPRDELDAQAFRYDMTVRPLAV